VRCLSWQPLADIFDAEEANAFHVPSMLLRKGLRLFPPKEGEEVSGE